MDYDRVVTFFKTKFMRKVFNLTSVLIIFVVLCSAGCGNQSKDGSMSPRQVAKWYEGGEWLGGCQLKPHSATNQAAFAKEYTAKKELWDKTFEWLKTNDLDTLSPGRYVIVEGNVTATISEAPAPELETVRWEVHRNFNDLQYIIKGKARMGYVPLSATTVSEEYDPKRDIGFCNAEGELYDAGPGTFFIFTPDDVHRPGIKADGYDEPVKKLVIKIRAADSAN